MITIRYMEDVHSIIYSGTGNKECDLLISNYYNNLSDIKKQIIKYYYYTGASMIKYHFNLNLNVYNRYVNTILEDVRGIINSYNRQRNRVIKHIDNCTDMINYRQIKAKRIQGNKYKLGIYN